MGIDLNVSVGLGAILPKEAKEVMRREFPDFDEDPDGTLFRLFKDEYPLLDLIESGSAWSGEVEYVLVLRSHFLDFDPEEQDGGTRYLNSSPVTSEELLQFFAAFNRLTGKDFTEALKPFVSLYVY